MAAFAPETIVQLGPLPITNTLLNTLLVDAALIGTAFAVKKHLATIPGKLQNLVEMVIEPFYNLVESISDKKRAVYIFPYFMTFFLFILLANWSGFIPGVNSVGFAEIHDGHTEIIPFLRVTTSDFNTTFALALISAVATHILAIRLTGLRDYLSRFFSINPILLFVGLLELVSEVTKIISLSFRLFGNIFAGETVLHTVSGLMQHFIAVLIPLPFMTLELIVGLVQALVFSMLTFVFMAILTTPHHATAEHHA